MSHDPLSHARLDELAAADALGGLDEDDRRELDSIITQHGPDCIDCQRLRADHAATAAELALSLPPRAPTPGAADRLLAAATKPHDRVQPGRSAPLRRRLLAAAAAVALLIAGGAVGYAVHPGRSTPSAQDAISGYLTQPGVRVVSFPAADGQRLAVLYQPGASSAWIVGEGLRQPADRHVYELWYSAPGSDDMKPAGLFAPDHDGSVRAEVDLADSVAALAVSVEPAGGSPHPTTQPVFLTTVPS